jgi:LAGLIDADG endonuclease
VRVFSLWSATNLVIRYLYTGTSKGIPEVQFQTMHLESYISGFVDGEGCFCVSFQPSSRHCLGWEVRPSFSVSQNADRAQLLYVIQQKWELRILTSLRPDRSDKTIKFEVRNIVDLVSKVVPHFPDNPLMSSKQNDFDKSANVCQRVSEGKHREVEGLESIVRLSMEMNPSGKRRYSAGEILCCLQSKSIPRDACARQLPACRGVE